MKRIGERIKKKRELLNLHLNELAEKVGVSPSALSQIEKSKSFPSIVTLKSIAEKLHTTVGDLIGENEVITDPVVYKKDMVFVAQNKSGTLFYMLSPHDASKQMDTFFIRFSKASGLDSFFATSFGQIFCYVLSGEVRFDLEGKNHFLKGGDTIYFSAKAAYNAINSFDGLSEMLWVQSPPHLADFSK